MAEIIWTEIALTQVNEIAEYIALENPQAASNLVAELFDKVDRLEQFPESGWQPPELTGPTYREVVVPPCRVFYRIDTAHVFIVYVMREEQELRRYVLHHGDASKNASMG